MNKEQFTAEVLKAEKSLYHIAKSILKNDEDCADAMQNAILSAYQKLHTLKNEVYFKTWITRILINESYQLIRERKKQVSYEDSKRSDRLFGAVSDRPEASRALPGSFCPSLCGRLFGKRDRGHFESFRKYSESQTLSCKKPYEREAEWGIWL